MDEYPGYAVGDPIDLTRERQRMIDEQLRGRDIVDRRVLEVMGGLPRQDFIAEEYRSLAYADAPLPIGHGQTISQPYMVALMTQLLRLQGDERVLEIGTGSGYQAAILASLAEQVYSIERVHDLVEGARVVIDRLGIANIKLLEGDGSGGLPDYAPYHAIMVTAAAPSVPHVLLQQLLDGGRLVIPVGGRSGQTLECWCREAEDWTCQRVAPVAFVPLIGGHGWREDGWQGWASPNW
jgi:protein-L-isoaspartate(D-aspartate) O-methyltransferase